MTFKGNLIMIGAGVALLALVACDKNNKSEETQTTGATQSQGAQNPGVNAAAANDNDKANKNNNKPNASTPDPNQHVIQQITQARCQREMACGKIGPNKHWTDEQACVSDLGNDTYEALKAKDCKQPLEPKVQTCLKALPNENCDNVESGLSRIQACEQNALCKD